jgi:hypothetical protein
MQATPIKANIPSILSMLNPRSLFPQQVGQETMRTANRGLYRPTLHHLYGRLLWLLNTLWVGFRRLQMLRTMMHEDRETTLAPKAFTG